MEKLYCVICHKYRKFEKLKISYLLKKALLSEISARMKMKKHLNKKIQLRNFNSWFN